MKATFVQFSHRLTAPVNPMVDYYTEKYSEVPGYEPASPDFVEIPTWVAVVAGKLESTWTKKFWVVKPEHTWDDTIRAVGDSVVFGSVMDINLVWYKALAMALPNNLIFLGGYVDPQEFDRYPNVIWMNTVEDLSRECVHVDITGSPDYSLFTGVHCIPRLQLSTGCKYNCAFCTIARTAVISRPTVDIILEALSFYPLRFKYIYLDDKTFGQADNWELIDILYYLIRAYNPEFEGWIIQTTAHEVIKHAESWVYGHGIKVIEIGVETLDQRTLNLWRKPHGVKHINKAAEVIRSLDGAVRFIPNLIFGIASDDRGLHDYSSTIDWVKANQDIISWVNPTILCQYHNSKGQVAVNVGQHASTGDESQESWDKSWLTEEEQRAACVAMEAVLDL